MAISPALKRSTTMIYCGIGNFKFSTITLEMITTIESVIGLITPATRRFLVSEIQLCCDSKDSVQYREVPEAVSTGGG